MSALARKSADEILETLAVYCSRITDSGHKNALLLILFFSHTGLNRTQLYRVLTGSLKRYLLFLYWFR